MYKIIISTILSTFILGCGEGVNVTFDEAQPVKTKPLSAFPKRIQGNYMDSAELTTLTVAEKMIYKTFEYDIKLHKDSLDSSTYLKDDTIINKESGEKFKVNLLGDSIGLHLHNIDTTFIISDSNVLKKFKGYYFLNYRLDKNSWQVKKISLEDGVLTIGNISDSTEINNLKELTETTADTASRNFSLTRKQFKQFINQHGFGDEEKFVRVSGNGR